VPANPQHHEAAFHRAQQEYNRACIEAAIERIKSFNPERAINDHFSQRERQVIELRVKGVPYHSIANQLGIHVRVVAHYLERARTKMGLSTNEQLLELVRRSR
jgi:DNA-binding CsgD family transcriptional regulator